MQKEYVAKSLEEALSAASAEFGVPEEQLKYQKISENGILFAKKVKILVTVPEKKEEPVAEPVAAPVEEVSAPVAFEAPVEAAAPVFEEKVDFSEAVADAINPMSLFPKSDKPAEEIACDFVSRVLEGMGIEAVVDAENVTEEETVYVNIQGPDMGVLIGKRGQTLDALQYLTSLVVNRSSDAPYMKVKLDTENYRARRKDTLENLARNIASKVRKTRRPATLEPMNPYERRIIHSMLQGDKYVETHSEGEEPYRRVVITLKKDAPRDFRYRKNNYGNNRGGYGNYRGGYGNRNNNKGGYRNNNNYGKKKFYPRHNEQSEDYSEDYKADYAAYLEQKAQERAAAQNSDNNSGSSLF